jgi:hypothetical protein
VNVTRDRAPPSSGSTVMRALGLIGPSIPRAAQLAGATSSVISCVMVRSAPRIRRVVTNRAPTRYGRSSAVRTLTTSFCHCANRVGSVT